MDILVGKPEGKNHSEDQCVNRMIILKWILEKEGLEICTGSIRFRTENRGGCL